MTSEAPICAVCGAKLLRAGANYCTQCNHYQHWGRRILADLNIQAFIALVPIVTLAFVFVKDQLVHHHSDVRILPQNCTTKQITLLATNLGDRPAALKSARAWLDTNGVKRLPNESHYYYLLKPTDTSIKRDAVYQFEPNKLRLIHFTVKTLNGIDTELPRPEKGTCVYRLSIELTAFDLTTQPVDATCGCTAMEDH